MSAVVPACLFVGLTVLVGWATLWTSRERLGALCFHLSALPLGLLGWTFVTAISVVTGRYNVLTVAAGLLLFIASMSALIKHVAPGLKSTRPASANLPECAGAGAAYLGATFLLTAVRITATTADSWKAYWPLGVMIEKQATFSAYLPSARGFVIPSFSAGSLFLGSEWEYVVYPLLACVVVLSVSSMLALTDLRPMGKKAGGAIAAAAALFLITDPSFLYHALYVHSHLLSAAYLFFALAGIRLAFEPDSGRETASAPLFLVLAGSSTAGLAMTRPDGLAYALIPVVIAVSVLADRRRESRDRWSFFGAFALITGVSLAASYIEVGVWRAEKLSGLVAAALYVLVVAIAFVPELVRKVGSRSGISIESRHLVWAAMLSGSALTLSAALLRWDVFSMAVLNARVNLFRAGGAYSLLWPSLFLVLAASILSGDATSRRSWSTHLFGAIVLFFLTAALVHGTSHPGRIGTGDSFSRVAFHIVPVLVWYSAIVTGRVVSRVHSRLHR